MKVWSRQLHRTTPRNLFKHTKVPYKTIFMSILFFVLGTYFFTKAFHEWMGYGDDTGVVVSADS